MIRTAEHITIMQESLGDIMQDATRVGEELDVGVAQTNIGIEAVRAQVDLVAQSIESAREEVRTGDARLEMHVGSIVFDVQRTVTILQQTQGDVREVRGKQFIHTGTMDAVALTLSQIRMALDDTQGNDDRMSKQLSKLQQDVRTVQVCSASVFVVIRN